MAQVPCEPGSWLRERSYEGPTILARLEREVAGIATQDTQFRDYQVFCLIKKHPGAWIYDLVKIARAEMSLFEWNYSTICNSVNRLQKRGRIRSELESKGGITRRRLHPVR